MRVAVASGKGDTCKMRVSTSLSWPLVAADLPVASANPDPPLPGDDAQPEPMRAWRRAWIDPTLCRGCATCLEFCPEGAIYLEEGLADLDPAVCDGCGVCARLCPSGAVFMEP